MKLDSLSILEWRFLRISEKCWIFDICKTIYVVTAHTTHAHWTLNIDLNTCLYTNCIFVRLCVGVSVKVVTMAIVWKLTYQTGLNLSEVSFRVAYFDRAWIQYHLIEWLASYVYQTIIRWDGVKIKTNTTPHILWILEQSDWHMAPQPKLIINSSSSSDDSRALTRARETSKSSCRVEHPIYTILYQKLFFPSLSLSFAHACTHRERGGRGWDPI